MTTPQAADLNNRAVRLRTLLAEQVRDLLVDRAARVADLLSDPALRADLEQRAETLAPHLARILGGDDDRQAAEVVADLYTLAHGDGVPDPRWWQTPLGRAIARSTGVVGAEAITPSIAAAMLGVSPPRVYQLRAAGKLDRHPDGGVTRASVLARLAGQTPRPGAD